MSLGRQLHQCNLREVRREQQKRVKQHQREERGVFHKP